MSWLRLKIRLTKIMTVTCKYPLFFFTFKTTQWNKIAFFILVHKDWCRKKETKRSSKILLCLLSFFLHQSLHLPHAPLLDFQQMHTIRLQIDIYPIVYFIWHKWAFHPIFVTWFLVVFGDQVTKILHNSLFTFLLSKERQAKWKFKVKKITQPK